MRTVFLLAFLSASLYGQQPPLGNAEIVILTGPPGSGKTLQSRNLSKKYKVPVISVSDLIRESLASRGPLAAQLSASVASGDLIDDQTAIQMISSRVNRADAAKGFILDGYPVSEAQAKFLDGFIVRNSLRTPQVVVLDAPDAIIRQRLLKRKRPDDTPQNIDVRIRQYHDEEKFLRAWYKPENTVRVDATKPAQEVFHDVEQGLIVLLQKKSKFKTR